MKNNLNAFRQARQVGENKGKLKTPHSEENACNHFTRSVTELSPVKIRGNCKSKAKHTAVGISKRQEKANQNNHYLSMPDV